MRLPEKVVTDVLAQALGFSGVNFCLGISLWEVTFVGHKVLVDFFNEQCITFNLRVKERMAHSLKVRFLHFQVHEDIPGKSRVLGLIIICARCVTCLTCVSYVQGNA